MTHQNLIILEETLINHLRIDHLAELLQESPAYRKKILGYSEIPNKAGSSSQKNPKSISGIFKIKQEKSQGTLADSNNNCNQNNLSDLIPSFGNQNGIQNNSSENLQKAFEKDIKLDFTCKLCKKIDINFAAKCEETLKNHYEVDHNVQG